MDPKIPHLDYYARRHARHAEPPRGRGRHAPAHPDRRGRASPPRGAFRERAGCLRRAHHARRARHVAARRPGRGALPGRRRARWSDVTGAGDTVIATLALALGGRRAARRTPAASPTTRPASSWRSSARPRCRRANCSTGDCERRGARAERRGRAGRAVSVPEVPPPGEHHREAVFVGRRNHLRVPHRAAGLHDRGRAAAATASRPSRNGKNASEAATDPASAPASAASARPPPSSPRRSPRPRGSSGRRRSPASGRRPVKITAFDFTCAQIRHAKRSACHSSAVGCRLVTTLQRPSPSRRGRRPRRRASRTDVALLHQQAAEDRPHLERGRRPASSARAKSATTTRMFFFAASTRQRLVVARRRDHRLDERRRDRPRPSRRRSAGSARRCRRTPTARRPRARARRRRPATAPVAAPHGFVCLMTTAAGSSNSSAMRAAESRSSRLVNDSSLPCSTSSRARPGRRGTTPPAGAGSRRSAGRGPSRPRRSGGRASPAAPGVRSNAPPATPTPLELGGDRRVVRGGVRERLPRQLEPERERRPARAIELLEHRA